MSTTPAGLSVPAGTGPEPWLRIPAAALGDVTEVVLDSGIVLRNRGLRRVNGSWIPIAVRPEVDRMEYRLSVTDTSGRTTSMPDPANERVLSDPFGDRSELLFPGYRRPAWLDTVDTGTVRDLAAIEYEWGDVSGSIWSPAGVPDDAAAPLLVVHDGSDLVARGSLLRWASAASERRPLRLLLLDPAPGRRAENYAADPDYADMVADRLLPTARRLVSTTAVLGWGASLGALAWLDLHRRRPGLLHALVLQSGSFFTPDLDAQEADWPFFAQVCAAVRAVEEQGVRAVPVALTCGTAEENLADNERMAATLRRAGCPVTVGLVRDGHTMIGFRDAWSPIVNDLCDRFR